MPDDQTTTDPKNQTSGANAGQQDGAKSLFDKFEIPDIVKEQYGELIPLILQTESMNDEERQYWFHILPIMTDDQVKKLREILANEKQELSRIDQEYEREVKTINEKHVTEWKAFEAKEKREKLKAAEEQAKQHESHHEEDILKQITNN